MRGKRRRKLIKPVGLIGLVLLIGGYWALNQRPPKEFGKLLFLFGCFGCGAAVWLWYQYGSPFFGPARGPVNEDPEPDPTPDEDYDDDDVP